MDIRSVQKSGNMFYVYLPTVWCKKHKISPNTKISIEENAEGALTIFSQISERQAKEISISLDKCTPAALEKLIMACYINPARSFKITLKESLKPGKILAQKSLFGVELIEINKNVISCESTISIDNPLSTLKTMIRRIRTLLYIMITDFNSETIEKYEEEIDRKKILIEKAVISSLAFNSLQKMKPIDLHYTSSLSKNLERLTDHLILLEESDKAYLGEVLQIADFLKKIIEENLEDSTREKFLEKTVEFIEMVDNLKTPQVADLKSYNKKRIKGYLTTVSEYLVDWAITKEIEKN